MFTDKKEADLKKLWEAFSSSFLRSVEYTNELRKKYGDHENRLMTERQIENEIQKQLTEKENQ